MKYFGFRKVDLILGASGAVLLLASCSATASESETSGSDMSAERQDLSIGEASAEKNTRNTAASANVSPIAAAAQACESGDYKAFFKAFVSSEDVRAKYSEPKIATRIHNKRPDNVFEGGPIKDIPSSEYKSLKFFPVQLVNGEYALSEANYADVNYNEPEWPDYIAVKYAFYDKTGSFDVSFVPTKYENGWMSEKGGLGEALSTYGNSQQLMFKKTDGCWNLTESYIYLGDGEK